MLTPVTSAITPRTSTRSYPGAPENIRAVRADLRGPPATTSASSAPTTSTASATKWTKSNATNQKNAKQAPRRSCS